jgi:hypothetical protein
MYYFSRVEPLFVYINYCIIKKTHSQKYVNNVLILYYI